MITTIIKYNKKTLISSFINRVNQMAMGNEKLMALDAKQELWFTNNIDYTAREIELLMSIVSSSPPIYSAIEIVYSIACPKNNNLDYLAEMIEKFFIEKTSERFCIHNATNREATVNYSMDFYMRIKSLTLKINKEQNGNYK